MQLSTLSNSILPRRIRGIPAFIWGPNKPVMPVYVWNDEGNLEKISLKERKFNIYGDWNYLSYGDGECNMSAIIVSYEQGWEILRVMNCKKFKDAPCPCPALYSPVYYGEYWECDSGIIMTGRLGNCCIIQASTQFIERTRAFIKWSVYECDCIDHYYRGNKKLFLNYMKYDRLHASTSFFREKKEREWWQKVLPSYETVLKTGWYYNLEDCDDDECFGIWLPCCCTTYEEKVFHFQCLSLYPFKKNETKDFSAQYRQLL